MDLADAVFHAEGEASDGEAAPNSFPQNSNPLPPNVVVWRDAYQLISESVYWSSVCPSEQQTWPVQVDKDWHQGQRSCVHSTTLHMALNWSKIILSSSNYKHDGFLLYTCFELPDIAA